MIEDPNPYVHPAQARFKDLLQEAELRQDDKQSQYGNVDDPFSNYRQAEAWGEEPWIACMIRVDDKIARLRNLAQGALLDEEDVRNVFMDIAVGTLNAMVLWEETTDEAQVQSLDLGQLSASIATMLRKMRERSTLTQEELRAHQEHAHFNFMPEAMDYTPTIIISEDHPALDDDDLTIVDFGEGGLVRELLRLKKVAPSSDQIGGAHASAADTDPDMGATGRRAREEEPEEDQT